MLQQRKPVARLTTPAQMVASLPLSLGFTPAESLVVMCCHEPRGRVGLTLRIDLPPVEHERAFVEEILSRVRHERASRVILAIYTDEPDRATRARSALVAALRRGLDDLIVTDLFLVRGGRFWSYLCDRASCCPPEGTPVDQAAAQSPLLLMQAERVLAGETVLPDRQALEASLAGPTFLAATAARSRCAQSLQRFTTGQDLTDWHEVIARWANPPAELSDDKAADLAISLGDVAVRDALGMRDDPDVLIPLVEELCRRTPAPYDAPVATLFAWLAYQAGGGARVSVALERALTSDPDYRLAQLLLQAVNAQVPPRKLRQQFRR